jgi:hypothetical protein
MSGANAGFCAVESPGGGKAGAGGFTDWVRSAEVIARRMNAGSMRSRIVESARLAVTGSPLRESEHRKE